VPGPADRNYGDDLHPTPTLAQWSAAHSLFWAETEARAYLETLARSDGVGSLEAGGNGAARICRWPPKDGLGAEALMNLPGSTVIDLEGD
jgi:hypothetical protein